MAITLTNYALNDERGAAKALGLSVSRLRWLCKRGEGPRHIELPSGDIRYRVEDLDAWASRGGVIHVSGDSNVVAFPGVRFRKHLPPEKVSGQKPRRPGRPRVRIGGVQRALATAARSGRIRHQKQARACLEHEDWLTEWEVYFLQDIAKKVYPLTEKQHTCLGKIIEKINGRLTKPRKRTRK